MLPVQDRGAQHNEQCEERMHVFPSSECVEGRHPIGCAWSGVQPCGWQAQGAKNYLSVMFSATMLAPASEWRDLQGCDCMHEE